MGLPRPVTYVGRVILDVAIVTAIIIFVPGFPPYVSFESFSLTPAMPLNGRLTRNSKLDGAVAILDGNIMGPESIAISRKNEVYTGLIGGEVIRYKNGKREFVAKFGQACEGKWEESKCGRPLGMRFDPNGKLVVVDAYYGLFRVDVDTGAVETLFSSNDTIEGKRPMLPNDLDIGQDGTIYWSDSSTNVYLQDSLIEFLGSPSGRLLKYDSKTKKTEVLLNNLHFANGVQLHKSEDFVLVSESVLSRVMKYNLRGAKKGQAEIFIDGLPGSPDNIRSNGGSGFYVSLIAPRYSTRRGFIDILGPLPYVRKFVLRIMCFVKALLAGIQSIVSIEYVDKAQYWLGHLEPAAAILPEHPIIVELDANGKIISSLQGIKGEVSHISEISLDNDRKFAYLGSPYNTKIWVVSVDELKPILKVPEITLG